VRNPVRKFVGVAVIGVMAAAFFAAASPAGAQTTTTVAQSCIFTVAPTTFPSGTTFPQNVTVSGTAAPDGATVTVFLNGIATTPTTTVVSGAFSVVISIPASGTVVSVGLTAAYAGSCATPEGLPSVVVSAEAAQVQKAPLAFTGSSNTPSYVLIGIAALVLGMVLVVAARRRSQVS
jgi:LPXTG-motif cell wall-anchored protein